MPARPCSCLSASAASRLTRRLSTLGARSPVHARADAEDFSALVQLAALNGRGLAEELSGGAAQRLRAVDHPQPCARGIETPIEELSKQSLHHGDILGAALDAFASQCRRALRVPPRTAGPSNRTAQTGHPPSSPRGDRRTRSLRPRAPRQARATYTGTTLAKEHCGNRLDFMRDFILVVPFLVSTTACIPICRQEEPPPSTHPFNRLRDIPRRSGPIILFLPHRWS